MGVAVDNPAIGYLAFAGVKAFGYICVAVYLNAKFKNTVPAVKIGIARLLIGMLFGVGVWGTLWLFTATGIKSGWLPIAYIALLFPVRCLEWHILFTWFYRKYYEPSSHKYKWLILGTIVSYILDVPATIGWVATSGFWIC